MRLVLGLAPAPEVKHLGPGPHPNGTPQATHGGGRAAGPRPLFSMAKTRIAIGDHWDHPMPAGAFSKGDPRNDAAYLRKTRQIEERINTALAEGRSTDVAHAAPGGVIRNDKGKVVRVIPSEEREELWLAIVESVFHDADERKVPKTKKAVMMGGLPGAGKSTYLKTNAKDVGLELDSHGEPANAVIVNPDEVKSLLLGTDESPRTYGDFLGPDHPLADKAVVDRVPGLTTGEHASIVHEESSTISKMVSDRALAEGYDVVFDITVNDAQKTTDKYLKTDKAGDPGALDLGYEVLGVFIDAPMEDALHRAGMRHKTVRDQSPYERAYSGRYVPLDLLLTGAPAEGATDRHGEPARSVNRVAFDELVEAGYFKRAARVDATTGELFTEVDDEVGVLATPRLEGRLDR